MAFGIASLWDTSAAKKIAWELADIGSYCGPAVVVWIAAIWNLHKKNRSYDYASVLRDRDRFPDGPRNFDGNGPGDLSWLGLGDDLRWQKGLSEVLQRETRGDLKLGSNTFYGYGEIHRELKEHEMPVVIRMKGPNFTDSLHYVCLYKSEKKKISGGRDEIQFRWQDNGFYGRTSDPDNNPGLHKTGWRKIGLTGSFKLGAKRVVLA